MPFRKTKGWGNVKPPAGTVYGGADIQHGGKGGIYLFNEGAGFNLSSTRPFNNGVASGGYSWAAGKFGPAGNFDGSTGKVSCGGTGPLDLPNIGISIVAWIYERTAGGGGFGRVIDKGTSYSLSWNSGKLAFVVSGINTPNTTTITSNVWHQFVATADVASGLYKLYLDGKLDASGTGVTGIASTATVAVIGGRASDNLRNWDGLIDHVRIYPFALTQSQIARLYAEPFYDYVTPNRRIISQVAATGFKPYWARQRSRIIGAGAM